MLQPGLVPAPVRRWIAWMGFGGGWLLLNAHQSPSRTPVSTSQPFPVPVHILEMGWGPADAWAPVNPHPAVEPFVHILQQGWGLADARALVGPHPAAEPVVHVLQQGCRCGRLGACQSPPSCPNQLVGCGWRLSACQSPASCPSSCAPAPQGWMQLVLQCLPPPRWSTKCAPVLAVVDGAGCTTLSVTALRSNPILHLFRQGWLRLARLALAQPGRWRWMIPFALLTCGRASYSLPQIQRCLLCSPASDCVIGVWARLQPSYARSSVSCPSCVRLGSPTNPAIHQSCFCG